MSSKHLNNIIIRQKIISLTRDFFEQNYFQEITVPVLTTSIPIEPNIYPFTTIWTCSQDNLYLSTSPESSLKQLLSLGCGNCFSIAHSFRNLEASGPTHQPEFLMLEYYQTNSNYIDMMDLTEKYINYIARRLESKSNIRTTNLLINPFDRISFTDLFKKYAGISVLPDNEPDLNQIFLNQIDPELKKLNRPIFITDYPAFMSPLAKQKQKSNQLCLAEAERFEFYVGNLEIANGNTENLIPQIPVTWKDLPPCAGVGLGLDRLAMIFTNSDSINSVIPFPL